MHLKFNADPECDSLVGPGFSKSSAFNMQKPFPRTLERCVLHRPIVVHAQIKQFDTLQTNSHHTSSSSVLNKGDPLKKPRQYQQETKRASLK